MAMCVLLLGWLGPLLDKRGYPSWAIVLKFVGGVGLALSWIIALTNMWP